MVPEGGTHMQINPLQGVERVGIKHIFKDLANRLGYNHTNLTHQNSYLV
jgi:hypothetical protein